jgi:hypothetical protein
VVSAFLRRAFAQGDFATILHRGDETSGAILLCGLIRGNNPVVFERFASMDGQSGWQKAMADGTLSQLEIDDYLKQRTKRDPDLWLIELDTADQERLTLLMSD